MRISTSAEGSVRISITHRRVRWFADQIMFVAIPSGRMRRSADVSLFLESMSSLSHETDRKSTRLNSSHDQISYAVFCLKKKKSYRPSQSVLRHCAVSTGEHTDCT